jgi:hypothetical protein
MRPPATVARPHSTVSVYQVYQGSTRRRRTFGVNLVSVQRLVGRSDPKITERRYSHFSPDFMSAEVNRVRIGLPALAPKLPPRAASSAATGSGSQPAADDGSRLGTPVVQSAEIGHEEGRDPAEKPSEVPVPELARDTGFEPVRRG